MGRKSNIDITGYSPIISESILTCVANREHTLAAMPYYNRVTEPEKLYEEIMLETRYKDLCDAYSRSFNIATNQIEAFNVMMNATKGFFAIVAKEKDNRKILSELVEYIVRREFNIDTTEVLFDLEIVDLSTVSLPSEISLKKVKPAFKQSEDLDVLKKRTINALSQGSALKSNYIFHQYRDEFNSLCPEITPVYNSTLIANELLYFLIDDENFVDILTEDETNVSGYCRINFDGDIPVIEARATMAPILIHEAVKGFITLLSITGLQKMKPSVIDETDFIGSELWEIRFGTIIWSKLHQCISINDYDIKKLIIKRLFELPSDEFLVFITYVHQQENMAKSVIDSIVKEIRQEIFDYSFDM